MADLWFPISERYRYSSKRNTQTPLPSARDRERPSHRPSMTWRASSSMR